MTKAKFNAQSASPTTLVFTYDFFQQNLLEVIKLIKGSKPVYVIEEGAYYRLQRTKRTGETIIDCGQHSPQDSQKFPVGNNFKIAISDKEEIFVYQEKKPSGNVLRDAQALGERQEVLKGDPLKDIIELQEKGYHVSPHKNCSLYPATVNY